jgi:hypothetical protein
MWSQRLKPARKKCFVAGMKMAQVLKKRRGRRVEKKKEHQNQDLDSPSESEFAAAARNRTPILPLLTIF